MSFEKRKDRKNVEELERDGLVEPTRSNWAAPSLLVPKIWNLLFGWLSIA